MNPQDLDKANDVFAKYGLSQEEAFDLFIERTAALGEMPFPIQNEVMGTYRTLALALSGNYEELYYVDLSSDHFIKFFAKKGDRLLTETQRGDRFFEMIQSAITIEVHPLDEPFVSRLFVKDNLVKELSQEGMISVTYRSVIHGKTEYHRLRIVQIDERDVNQIVIGVINEDEQVRREKEWRNRLKSVKTLAKTDRLTGLFNRSAFDQDRHVMNRKIKAGKAQFAVVVCDLNNLKTVNDVSGHLAGDVFIKEGAQRLSKAFSPNKVYRIGGDEFAVILQGDIYQNRMYIVSSLMKESLNSQKGGQFAMAVGMAEFDSATDRNFSNVFLRADMAMYEHKRKLKNL